MQVRLQQQPFRSSFTLVHFLREAIQAGPQRLDIVVAWAKRSGFHQVGELLRAFTDAGGMLRIIVGIGSGGATRQGLERVIEYATEAYVYNDSRRTFHPKLYVAVGESRADVLVGSSNLTRGGAIDNFELGVAMTLQRGEPGDEQFLVEVNDYVELLISESEVCLPLDESLLQRLMADSSYAIGDEDASRGSAGSAAGDDEREVNDLDSEDIFGRTLSPLSASRAPATDRHQGLGVNEDEALETGAEANTGSIARRWFRRLRPSNAQRLPGTSNPSGHMTLVAAGHPVDSRTYFRAHFFGDLDWHTVEGGRERASARIEVFESGRLIGTHDFLIDHNPAFEAGQNNRTTTLRWGDLQAYLQTEIDHSEDYVTIERLSDGRTRLTFAATPMGDFVE